ncbi:ABC transporter substrate-binding protein [Vibrio aphrogenes]|uniref:ABC transporter substrate-binding protein n=1 Tax=Vibrio aphrogenes TaxID=1891186 RepID=UPI000B35B657|nr:ABC transporter substrate-binding protein [Vibrio aphrogenes]
MKRTFLLIISTLLPFFSYAAEQDWQATQQQAKGQDVYFNAWGGSQEINQYLRWVAREVKQQYGIQLHHVKVSDTSEITARLLAEKAAAQHTNGSVDIVWINGENFKSMKDHQLLFGPFTQQLPNWDKVDASLPIDKDFSEPTDGLEAPWGVGQLVFIYDHKKLPMPPTSAQAFLDYAKAHPGRITYPKPPQFHGSSFLKALLIELTKQPAELGKPVDTDTFASITAPLWRYLDTIQPYLWQQGKQFPSTQPEMLQLLDDGQIDIAITFNPNEVSSAQASGKLAPSTDTYAWDKGALSNIHFLAIPWNAKSKPAALVVINFLLSPEAQSRKGDNTVWGDPSVLRTQYLTGSAAKTQLFSSVEEPHPSWQDALEQAWLARYSR